MGIRFESGEPAFIMGDTVYDVFGMDYCGGDIETLPEAPGEAGLQS